MSEGRAHPEEVGWEHAAECVWIVSRCLSVISSCVLPRAGRVYRSQLGVRVYATTSGVLRKAAILRHPVGRSDREMECAGGVEYQRGRAAVRQAFDGVVATMVRGRLPPPTDNTG